MLIAALLFYLLLALGVALNWLPLWLLGAYGALGLISFASYGLDKRAAIKDNQRTPERKLLGLALLGGFAGAMLAMALFRHKTSKRSFLWLFYGVTALHLVVAAALIRLFVWPQAPL
ncbi:DUF1294 domain-containing protein [Shewanella sp. JM162201]|uniref:DUF1294 domain-containing protein n=1 Tax=Shewanella jiangmenensis TaxID=2837387 RepID=A0ABS5V1P8_9GAMM|nr:DUF1294 domain-containing protein [Shewanella jiangmenensis]MBT1444345.1 DUF1294 domain-containing protein [Shewanella jiangmenensis]